MSDVLLRKAADVTSSGLVAFLASSAVIKLAYAYLTLRKRPTHAERVGEVSSLTIYPVKSMRGVSLQKGACVNEGLALNGCGDRSFVVTTGPNYRFITARQEPTIILITPSFHGDTMHLDAPGMSTLRLPMTTSIGGKTIAETKIWGDPIEGVDCGDEAAVWLDKYLGKTGFRLLQHAPGLSSRQINNGPTEYHKKAKDVDQIPYQDTGPYLVISESSLVDLNKRLDTPVDMRRFRPNIVIKTDSDIPFDEDNWVELYIGNCKFTGILPCDRCRMTTVDPDKGTRDPAEQPLKELQKYRVLPGLLSAEANAPYIGTWLLNDWSGHIQTGDPVYVIRGKLS